MKKIALVLLLLSGTVNAQFYTGQKLFQVLEEDVKGGADYSHGVATGYIVGVADTWSSITVCSPATTTIKQMKQVVFNYMTNHPELWDKPADQVVSLALGTTWPCKKK